MIGLNDALGLAQEAIGNVSSTISEYKTEAIIGGSALALGSGLGVAAIVASGKSSNGTKRKAKSKNKRKRSHRIKHTKRGLRQDRKRRSKQKWELAYQRRKKKGKKHKKRKAGRHYTKNGQPYIILKSGKARFVKK